MMCSQPSVCILLMGPEGLRTQCYVPAGLKSYNCCVHASLIVCFLEVGIHGMLFDC
jgi:hypothetical protein